MRIAIPRETESGERRAALVPDSVKKLVRLGAEVKVEQGLGSAAGFSDEEYGEAGAQVLSDRATLLGAADMVLRVRKPSIDDLALLKPGCIHASFLDPFNETDLIDAMCERDV
ncbi:MAG: NAD(P)(+) transhydrogenase (Re/Si-specific) subunit alpha, partial [Pseudomonadales bacterium]|nr:NAD(P)(+) transhydrogenase (Re/Si-specific) subunit alpha [Pseudomonadales bacterium]